MDELIANIIESAETLKRNLTDYKRADGTYNKAAGARARKNTFALAALYKQFRKESVKL